jgi:hypothetical protein
MSSNELKTESGIVAAILIKIILKFFLANQNFRWYLKHGMENDGMEKK